MSMTREAKMFHSEYRKAPEQFREVVDESYQAVRSVFMAASLPLSNTDAAEELVAAIFKYMIVSRQDQLTDRTQKAAERAERITDHLDAEAQDKADQKHYSQMME